MQKIAAAKTTELFSLIIVNFEILPLWRFQTLVWHGVVPM